MTGEANPFAPLGLGQNPLLLAPLAGVSDHPFRRTCAAAGASLTYVEMLSATALLFESPRTYGMMARHPDEGVLGVQITGKSADEIGRAVEVLDRCSFETIDINMGCPVSKVVKGGCGSAILKDPGRVFSTVRLATEATSKPVSAKIRLGWDKSSYTYLEVADAIEQAGAKWLTVHGRLRSDDYSVPVDIVRIAEIKRRLKIPVIGNGNLFCKADAELMYEKTGVDGLMVSRGALGNPWVFRELRSGDPTVTLAEWRDTVLQHLAWQGEAYPGVGHAAVCMRKHLLWYVKGWPGAKRLREELSQMDSLDRAKVLVEGFAEELARQGTLARLPITHDLAPNSRFVWDPKFEMDRRLDRGVGDDLVGMA